MSNPLVELKDFALGFATMDGFSQVLHGIDITVNPGEMVGIVGESGSGKTVTAKYVLGILPRHTMRVMGGSARLLGKDLLSITPRERSLLKRHLAYVPQDPMAALNPSFKIATQMIDLLIWDWSGHTLARYLLMRRNPKVKRRALDLAAELLDRVKIRDPRDTLNRYPVELSGGMRQRVLLALSLSGEPQLLIADEPTTALDVTVQKRTIELIQELVEREKLAGLYITHDLGVARWLCSRSYVMNAGRVVEAGLTTDLLDDPQQPYTQQLVAAIPRFDTELSPRNLPHTSQDAPALSVRGLVKRFGTVDVVKGVSFDVAHGETLAIVGESGSGKSTIAKMVAGYLDISGGELLFSGTKMGTGSRVERLAYRDKVQMVFQDPASSLNPRQTLEQIIGLPLHLRGMVSATERRDTVADLLDQVHLPRSFIHRRPTSLSGGQKQRASIARALALKPSILVLDEPTSALDVSVQARIVDLLKELREKLSLTYIFISHDLGVVRNIADRVAVMYHGGIVEIGQVDSLFSNPQSNYAKTLIAAVPQATTSSPKQRPRIGRTDGA